MTLISAIPTGITLEYCRKPGAREWIPFWVVERGDNTLAGWAVLPGGSPLKWISQAWHEDDPALTNNQTAIKLLQTPDTGIFRLTPLAKLMMRVHELEFLLDERKQEWERKGREAVPFKKLGRPPKAATELATAE